MLIVTGTPRSGTGFMSQLLTKAGIPCGHEQIYGFEGGHRVVDPKAESSWLAAPHLKKHKDIVHIVRDPLKVISSQKKYEFLHDNGDFAKYAYEHCPGILIKKGFDRYMYFYIKWNEMIEEHTDRRYKVEEIDVKEFIENPKEIYDNDKYNTDNVARYYTLDDIPESPLKEEFKQKIIKYGYENICSSTK